MMVRKINVISPAKHLTCGIEAINLGADAVYYIGAPKFVARIAAGNSLEDINYCIDSLHSLK
jgi:putative protease